MTIPVWTEGPTENGRRRIVRWHGTPDRLPDDKRRTADAEVDPDTLTPPDTELHEVARPWLNDQNEVEWDVEDRPDDDPAQIARRLGQVEAATGAGRGQGERGIAQRLDDIEDRIAALEG